MATSTQPKTETVTPERWKEFLAKLTQELRGAHAKMEVMGKDAGYQVPTDNRPFDGIAADVNDGECAVWITFGGTSADHLAHGVQSVIAVRIVGPMGRYRAIIEIEAVDETRTLLSLSRPEDYALPPGSPAGF